MGQNYRENDVKIRRKQTLSLPSHESPLSRGVLKSKGGGKLSVHFCADGETMETFFAQLFLPISSVSTEQSQICVRNTRRERPVLAGQSDPLFEPADLLITTPSPSIEIPAQEIFISKVQRTSGKALTTRPIEKICTDAGFLTTVEVGQYFMTKDTEEFSQFTDSVACREYILPRDENHLTQKVGFEGTPKLGPYWKSQPITYKVNMEWKSELNLKTKTILTRGSEFLMA